ncbi:MAG TPA: hypothetical protein VNS12_10665 [Pelagibacterium sp.]|uniref:hypothetical protein n=1 Tax=Pelagibacterium sp. TaxID=1967288 RepID=UPI002CE6B419|nr:hypothetical protein [Pelagibacterium sp.]HWJ88523.1 hypothetical protein [Pelagibacterium sp.]
MTNKKQPIDWAAIEKDYRGTTRSIREIAAWFSITEGAIRKRAKKHGWVREAVEASTQAETVEPVRIPRPIADVPKVEEVIGRGRNLADRLLDELTAETMHLGELEAIIMMNEVDPDRVAALKQAVSLPVRAKTLQTIALALKTMGETADGGRSGKKAARQARAEGAAGGGSKFAAPSAPKLVVDNKR